MTTTAFDSEQLEEFRAGLDKYFSGLESHPD